MNNPTYYSYIFALIFNDVQRVTQLKPKIGDMLTTNECNA